MIARISLAIVVALWAATASGEIYKCTAKKRITTYQNFPCEFDSLGAMPTEFEAGTAASRGTAPGGAPTPASAGVHRNPVHRAAAPSVPRVGMTSGEVKAIWGEPVDTSKEEFVKGDIETWTYADSRSVQFDRKGRVTSIKW